MPSKLAVFPSGQFLISGLKYDTDIYAAKLPVTGIFASDGSLLKTIKLEDDEKLHDMAATGDARVTTPGITGMNKAVSNGYVEVAGDGNAYLMRWTDPAIFYAISAGGEVVRRFTVDSGEAGYMPTSMHVHKNRIAVMFVEPGKFDRLIMKLVDLEGREIATYEQDAEAGRNMETRLSAVFACYTENPARFVFAGADDENHLQFFIAEGR